MGFIGVQPASVPLTASDITNDIINADKIADNSISEEHLDATVITGLSALAEAPADTDEFMISDGGVLKRIDASFVGGGGTNTPYFQASVTSNQSISHDVTTKANFDRADVDSASGYDTTNKRYTIPSGQGGYWHIGYSVAMDGGGEYIKSNYIYPMKNGSTNFPSFNSRHQGVASRRADSYPFRASTMNKSFIVNLSASDYIEIHVNYGDSRGGGNTVNIGEYYSIFWGYRLAQ